MLSLRKAIAHAGSSEPSISALKSALDITAPNLRMRRVPFDFRVICYNTAFVKRSPADDHGSFDAPRSHHLLRDQFVDIQWYANRFVEKIRASDADVVCLCEVFHDEAFHVRQFFKEALAEQYPHHADGPPAASIGLDLEDSGLLLLSRRPIVDTHRFAFSHSSLGYGPPPLLGISADTIASKGIVHVRVKTGETHVDVFVTHLQAQYDDSPTYWLPLTAQLHDVDWFAKAVSGRATPAVLTGDFNVDAVDEDKYDEMFGILDHPVDTWTANNPGEPGFTFKDGNSFGGSPREGGERLDYILQRSTPRLVPIPDDVEVLRWKADGHDLSDHFGLQATYSSALALQAGAGGEIRSVSARLTRLRALLETDSDAGAIHDLHESDEVKMTLKLRDAHGEERDISVRENGLDTGETRSVTSERLRLEGDPGGFIELELKAKEIDAPPDGDDNMGQRSLRLSREELLEFVGGARRYVLPRLTRQGGDYAFEVEVIVS